MKQAFNLILFCTLFCRAGAFQSLKGQEQNRLLLDNVILGNEHAYLPMADGWYAIEASFSGKLTLGGKTFNAPKLQRYIACFDQDNALVWKKDMDAFTMEKKASGKTLRWIEQVRVKDKTAKTETFSFTVNTCDALGNITTKKLGPWTVPIYNGNIVAKFAGENNLVVYGLFHGKTAYVKYKTQTLRSSLEGAAFYFITDMNGNVSASDKIDAGVDGFTYPSVDDVKTLNDNSFHMAVFFGAKCEVPQVKKSFTTKQLYGYRPGEMPLYMNGIVLVSVENGKVQAAEKILEGYYLQPGESGLDVDSKGNIYLADFAQGSSVYHKENTDGYADYNPPRFFGTLMGDCGLNEFTSVVDNTILVQIKPGLQASWYKTFKSPHYNRPAQLSVYNDSVYLMINVKDEMTVDDKVYKVTSLGDAVKDISDRLLVVMNADGRICRSNYFCGNGDESVFVQFAAGTLITFGSYGGVFNLYNRQWEQPAGRSAFVFYPGRHFKQANVSNNPVSTSAVNNTGFSSANTRAGQRVFAWYAPDKKYYSATVKAVSGDKVTVQYDDGYNESKPYGEIKSLPALTKGEQVQARWSDGKYYPATVLEISGNSISIVYNSDNSKETVTADRIMQLGNK